MLSCTDTFRVAPGGARAGVAAKPTAAPRPAGSKGGAKQTCAAPVSGATQHRTLDLEHSSTMQRLSDERAHARALLADAETVRQRIRELEGVPPCERSDADFDELKRCWQQHDKLVECAREVEQNSDEDDYLLRTSAILFRYYDIIDKGSGGPTAPTTATATATAGHGHGHASAAAAAATATATATALGAPKPLGIMRYLMAPPPPSASKAGAKGAGAGAGAKSPAAAGPCSAAAATATATATATAAPQVDDRASLFVRFKHSVDGRCPPSVAKAAMAAAAAAAAREAATPPNPSARAGTRSSSAADAPEYATGPCGHCGHTQRTMQLQDGCVYCNRCFTLEYILIDHEKPSYKDPPKEVSYFAYKRINHFNEWLNQVQGKETTEIPEEVYDSILFEIKKQKLTNMATLTRKTIKAILKKLRIHKYYEHCNHIMNRLNGMPSPHFPPELEDRLRHMFCDIQVPFLKHAPPTRKNFLSYSYCLNKMFQLLEKDQYLDSFPLLKSREKLHLQDQIWQKICEDLGWDFIPSL